MLPLESFVSGSHVPKSFPMPGLVCRRRPCSDHGLVFVTSHPHQLACPSSVGVVEEHQLVAAGAPLPAPLLPPLHQHFDFTALVDKALRCVTQLLPADWSSSLSRRALSLPAERRPAADDGRWSQGARNTLPSAPCRSQLFCTRVQGMLWNCWAAFPREADNDIGAQGHAGHGSSVMSSIKLEVLAASIPSPHTGRVHHHRLPVPAG